MLITVAMASAPFLTTGRCSPAPTARIQACGGLMTAANSLMPNMPRLEMVKPPPWYSSGLSLPSLARAARSFISAEMVGEALLVGFADDRRDQATVDGDRDRDVDVLELVELVAAPRSR